MDSTYAATLGGALKSFCASLGVPFVDATGRFTELTQRGKLIYLPYDTHLSPLGHQVLADVVAERIAAAGEFPGRSPAK